MPSNTQYTEFDLYHAIQAVENGQSLREVARDYEIPRGTLRRRIGGSKTRKQGAQDLQRLSPIQEEELVNWISTQEAMGTSATHAQIKLMA